jgi:hypothetical protein
MLRLLVAGLQNLRDAPAEILSDRDPALVIAETPAHRPVFAPEWSDLAATLGTRPKACWPYRLSTGQDQGQGRAGDPGGQGGLPRPG